MQKFLTIIFSVFLFLSPIIAPSSSNGEEPSGTAVIDQQAKRENSTEEMLSSLLDLQKNLNEQIVISKKEIKNEQFRS